MADHSTPELPRRQAWSTPELRAAGVEGTLSGPDVASDAQVSSTATGPSPSPSPSPSPTPAGS